MEWINKKMMTWGVPVNLLATIANSLVALLGKIYENRKVWVIVALGIFAAMMGLLRMRIDKLVSDDKSKMETDLRATIDRLTDLNEELIHRNKELMSEVRSLKDEVKSLRDEVNTLQTTIDNQSSKIDSMESNVGNVQESTNDTRDVLTTKMETLKSNVDDVRESTNETRDDVKSLKTDMRQMQDAIMEMQPSDYQYQEIVDAEIETFMGH